MVSSKVGVSAAVMAILACITVAAPTIEGNGTSGSNVTLNITGTTELTKRGINSHTIRVPVENTTRGPRPVWSRRLPTIEQPKNAPPMSPFFGASTAAMMKRSAKNTTIIEEIEVSTEGSRAAEATAEGDFKQQKGKDGDTTTTTVTTTTTTTTTGTERGEADAEAVVTVGEIGGHHYPEDYEDDEQYQSSDVVEELEAFLEKLRIAQHLADLEFGTTPAKEGELEVIFGARDTTSFSIISTTTAISNVSTSSTTFTRYPNTTCTTPATSTTFTIYPAPITSNPIVNIFTASTSSFTPSPTPPSKGPELPNSMTGKTALSLNTLTRYCRYSLTPRDLAVCACVVGGIELSTGADIALVDAECFGVLHHELVADIPALEELQGLWKRNHVEVDQTYCPVTTDTEGAIVIAEDNCLPKDFVEGLFLLESYIEDQEQQKERGHGLLSHMDITKQLHKRGMNELGHYLRYSPIKAVDTQQQLSKLEAIISPKNRAAPSPKDRKLEKSAVARVRRVERRGTEELEKLDLEGLGLDSGVESDALIETAVMGMSEVDLVKLLEKLEDVLL